MNICAYHGNLYLPEFKEHLYEMRMKGFDAILFAISETDATYNQKIFKEFREYAEAVGFKTIACFWGYSAGEAILTGTMTVKEWMITVMDIGFKNVMIDEPRNYLNWSSFLDFHEDVNLSCIVPDDVFDLLTDEEIKTFPVKMFGFSNYHTIDDYIEILKRSEDRCRRLLRLRPDDNFVFIQGFNLKKKTSLLPIILKDVCSNLGIKNFGFWSFRCAEATGSKRSEDHEKIWYNLEF